MATPTDNAVALSGDPKIDGLVQGSAWTFGGGPRTITYSLSLNDNPNGGPWTASLTEAMKRALTAWSDVANIVFVEYDSGTVYNQSRADIAITLAGDEMRDPASGLEVVGYGIFPSPTFVDRLIAMAGETRATAGAAEGDIVFDNYHFSFGYLAAGGLGFSFMLHEIGHALGLKHPFDDGGNGRPTFDSAGIGNLNATANTVMGYPDVYTVVGEYYYANGNPATPMPLDVLAVQRMYGVNSSYHTGDDSYVLALQGGARALRTLWDAGGTDTLVAGEGAYGSSRQSISGRGRYRPLAVRRRRSRTGQS